MREPVKEQMEKRRAGGHPGADRPRRGDGGEDRLRHRWHGPGVRRRSSYLIVALLFFAALQLLRRQPRSRLQGELGGDAARLHAGAGRGAAHPARSIFNRRQPRLRRRCRRGASCTPTSASSPPRAGRPPRARCWRASTSSRSGPWCSSSSATSVVGRGLDGRGRRPWCSLWLLFVGIKVGMAALFQ